MIDLYEWMSAKEFIRGTSEEADWVEINGTRVATKTGADKMLKVMKDYDVWSEMYARANRIIPIGYSYGTFGEAI